MSNEHIHTQTRTHKTHLAILGWPENVEQGGVYVSLAVCVVLFGSYFCCAAGCMHLSGYQLGCCRVVRTCVQ